MIAVDVREQNLVDFFRSHGLDLFDDTIQIRIRAQRHVNHDDALSAHDVLIGALECHDARIVCREFSDKFGCRHTVSFLSTQRFRMNTHLSKKKRQRTFAEHR